jgi:hypothetical protein
MTGNFGKSVLASLNAVKAVRESEERLPYAALHSVKKHLRSQRFSSQGVHVAHDSIGCPRRPLV